MSKVSRSGLLTREVWLVEAKFVYQPKHVSKEDSESSHIASSISQRGEASPAKNASKVDLDLELVRAQKFPPSFSERAHTFTYVPVEDTSTRLPLLGGF